MCTMASQIVLNKLLALCGKRPRQQGLPIINQMIDDAGDESIPAAVRVASAWMTDDELGTFASLCIGEGEWVAGNAARASTGTAEELLRDFGIIGDEGDTWEAIYA